MTTQAAARPLVLVVEKVPTSHELRFTVDHPDLSHMLFERVPAGILFPRASSPERMVEAKERLDGERIPLDPSRREALTEWYAAARRSEQ